MKKKLKTWEKRQKKAQGNSKEEWQGRIAVVLASGPSLGWEEYADVNRVQEEGLKCVAVNSTWEKARFCDAIYAGDGIWWKFNHFKIDIPAQRWTCSKGSIIPYGCIYRARFIKPGYNSGANAVELVANVYRASAIILLGFDCSVTHGVHHHGKHQQTSNPNQERANRWKRQFKCLRDKTEGTRIINCSRYSEIPYFEKMPLDQALKELNACGLS